MGLSETIVKRLRELFLDGHWITNTNYKEILTDTTKDEAIAKISDLNSLAELTYHVNYYLSGLNNVFNGGALEIRDKYSFDITPIETEEDWQRLVLDLINNAEAFINHVSSMSEENLHGPFIVEKYGSYLRNIEGVIEHAYYHLGQMVIIKKMIRRNLK
jgi:uncharacterized damage-inducible protein DinB